MAAPVVKCTTAATVAAMIAAVVIAGRAMLVNSAKTRNNMKPYMEQILLAQRWDKVVDYGSPMSAWTKEMFDALDAANGDKVAAMKSIKSKSTT